MTHFSPKLRNVVVATAVSFLFAFGLFASSAAAVSAGPPTTSPPNADGTHTHPDPHAEPHPNEHAYGKVDPPPAPTPPPTPAPTPPPTPTPAPTPGTTATPGVTPTVTQTPAKKTAATVPVPPRAGELPTLPLAEPVPVPVPVIAQPSDTHDPFTVTEVPDRSAPGTPSVLSHGMITLSDIISNPLIAATAGFLGIALVMLVLVANEFVGEALSHQYALLAGFLRRRRRLAAWSDRVSTLILAHPVVSSIALIGATSSIFTLVDPSLGLDLVSLRLWLSCAVAIILINYVSILITGIVTTRIWGVHTMVRIMPWGLAVAVVGVILSRVLNVSPGFLVGAILGIAAVSQASARLVARVVQTRAVVVLAVSVSAWLLLELVPVFAVDDPRAFWSALATDSLVATSAAGLTALVVGLLPLSLLEGGELYHYSRREWAITFGAAALAFCLIEIPSAADWLDIGNSLTTWTVIAACAIGIAAAVYVISWRLNRRVAIDAPEERREKVSH